MGYIKWGDHVRSFIPDAKSILRIENEKIRKEKLLFLSLCSQLDRDMLQCKREMSLQDFNRIMYLIYNLGFESYYTELSGIYYDLFIKDYPCKDEDMYKWLEDFCNQLPTDTMKTFIRELLYIK